MIYAQPDIPANLPLWNHQREGYWFCYPQPATLIAAGLGTGKSGLALALTTNWHCQRTLIVCPASVRNVWRREIPRHCPGDPLALILDGGSVGLRQRVANAAWSTTSNRPLYVVLNYEASWRYPMRQWLLSREWDCVILDEAHAICKLDSEQSRFCGELSIRAKHRLALTGTCLAHRPTNALGICRFLDPNLFGPDHDAALKRYAAPEQDRTRKRYNRANAALREAIALYYGPDAPMLDDIGDSDSDGIARILPGLQHAAEYERKLATITWRCRSEDVLDLPPLIQQDRIVTLGTDAREIYESLERHAYAAWESGQCTIDSHGGLITRLQQVTSGYLPDDGDGTLKRVDSAKADALYDLLSEAGGEPAVVFCRFVADLDRVAETAAKLGLTYREISGRRKDGLTNLGTLTPGTEVCGVQPKSGGVGVELTAAKIGVWFSYPRVPRGVRPGDQATAPAGYNGCAILYAHRRPVH